MDSEQKIRDFLENTHNLPLSELKGIVDQIGDLNTVAKIMSMENLKTALKCGMNPEQFLHEAHWQVFAAIGVSRIALRDEYPAGLAICYKTNYYFMVTPMLKKHTLDIIPFHIFNYKWHNRDHKIGMEETVIHKDGNIHNCEIDNLEVVPLTPDVECLENVTDSHDFINVLEYRSIVSLPIFTKEELDQSESASVKFVNLKKKASEEYAEKLSEKEAEMRIREACNPWKR